MGGAGQLPPPGVAPGYPPPPGYTDLPPIPEDNLSFDGSPRTGVPDTPLTQTADIIVNGYPARTGRIMFGGAVNSDAGVTGQLTVEERNFDITRFPRSFQDLIGGTAFRGAGQTFRLEAMPGNVFQRYTVAFSDPFLFGYLPISTSVSGFLFDRRFRDWDEERLGGRLSFGYRITPDLSISTGIRLEEVTVTDPRATTVPELNAALGDNDMYSWQARLIHDTRDNPFAPSSGHYLESSFEQAFGDWDFNRYDISYNRYFLIRERADRSGRQTLTMGLTAGFSGEDTPIFENYFAGGYTTLRGFEFRGASPAVNGVQVGGRFQFLGTFEYMFPLTADDMLRGVAFVDYGTVERDIEMNRENFRVAPGFGVRIAVPALGPAPLAFDFAFPVADAAGDRQQTFSFFMGYNRRF
jgi:outer membrane protein insertion porin family